MVKLFVGFLYTFRQRSIKCMRDTICYWVASLRQTMSCLTVSLQHSSTQWACSSFRRMRTPQLSDYMQSEHFGS